MVYSYIRNKKYNNVTIINKMHTQVCAKGDTLYNTIYKPIILRIGEKRRNILLYYKYGICGICLWVHIRVTYI